MAISFAHTWGKTPSLRPLLSLGTYGRAQAAVFILRAYSLFAGSLCSGGNSLTPYTLLLRA